MTSRTIPTTPLATVKHPELPLSGKVTLALLAILGLGALGGGGALVARPDGSAVGFSVDMLAGSPFPDFLVPGLILGGLFGVGSFGVLAIGLRHVRLAPFLAFGIGVAQMIWIAVELAIIGEFSFLHPTLFGVGLILAAFAVQWGWPTLRGSRLTR